MRRWVLSLALGGSVFFASSGVAAMSHERAFERPPLTDPAYSAIRALEQRGYSTGFALGSFTGGKRFTRYEFAVTVQRLFRSLRDRISVAASTSDGRYFQDLDRFRGLYLWFRGDLEPLGVDRQEMDVELERLTAHLTRLRANERSKEHTFDTLPVSGMTSTLPAPQPGAPTPRHASQAGSLASRSFLADPRGLRPGAQIGGTIGRANLEFGTRTADSLKTAPSTATQFQSSLAPSDYHAMLSVPIGKYVLHGFYQRAEENPDQFRFFNPYGMFGPNEGIGAGISGPLLVSWLGFQLESGSQNTQRSDAARSSYFRGSLRLYFSRSTNVRFGYERARDTRLLGLNLDSDTLLMGIGHDVNPWARFEVLSRFTRRNQVTDGGGGRPFDDTSYFGQFTIRF